MKNDHKCHVCKARHGFESHPQGVRCLTCGNVVASERTLHVGGNDAPDDAVAKEPSRDGVDVELSEGEGPDKDHQ